MIEEDDPFLESLIEYLSKPISDHPARGFTRRTDKGLEIVTEWTPGVYSSITWAMPDSQ